MHTTHKDRKDKDPVDSDPTNTEIVRYLQRGSMHFCTVLRRHIYKPSSRFEFRTQFGGTPHCFEAQFVDLQDFKVVCTTTKETFRKYRRAYALTSLLHDKCFSDVEAFAVACRNALGDDIQTEPLAGCIFVDGQCVDELIDAPEEKAIDQKQLATDVQKLQGSTKIMQDILAQIVTSMYVARADSARE